MCLPEYFPALFLKNYLLKICTDKQNHLLLCCKDEGERAGTDFKEHHIKVDRETLQIIMKYRDKLSRPMAGLSTQPGCVSL